MNEFIASREKGNTQKQLAHQILEKYFADDFLCLHDVPDGRSKVQSVGVDVFVVLNGGKVTTADVKADFSMYSTILLETHSSVEHNKPGWALDPEKVNEWILYMKPNLKEAFMLNTTALARVMRSHYQGWCDYADAEKDGFRWIFAQNPGYRTRCLVVPREVILAKLGTQIHITWNGEKK